MESDEPADPILLARAAGGLLSIMTLLGLLVGDFLLPDVVLSNHSIVLISALITGLLGVDILVTRRERLMRAGVGAVSELTRSDTNLSRRDRTRRAVIVAAQEAVGYEYEDFERPHEPRTDEP